MPAGGAAAGDRGAPWVGALKLTVVRPVGSVVGRHLCVQENPLEVAQVLSAFLEKHNQAPSRM